jgi:hypothetical protein
MRTQYLTNICHILIVFRMKITWCELFDEDTVSHKYLSHTDCFSNENNLMWVIRWIISISHIPIVPRMKITCCELFDEDTVSHKYLSHTDCSSNENNLMWVIRWRHSISQIFYTYWSFLEWKYSDVSYSMKTQYLTNILHILIVPQMKIFWRELFDEDTVSHKYFTHTDCSSNKNILMNNQYLINILHILIVAQMKIFWCELFDEDTVSHKYFIHTDCSSNENNLMWVIRWRHSISQIFYTYWLFLE